MDQEKTVQTQKKAPLRKRVHIAAKIPLQLLSFLLSIMLFVAVLATALLADLRILTHGDGIQKIVDTIFSTVQSLEPELSVPQQTPQIALCSDTRQTRSGGSDNLFNLSGLPFGYDQMGMIIGYTDKNGQFIGLPETVIFYENKEGALQAGLNLQTDEPYYVYPALDGWGKVVGLYDANGEVVPLDLTEDVDIDLTNPDSLIDYVQNQLAGVLGEDANISRETLETFYEESTISSFLSEKVGSAVKDVISGSELGELISSEDIQKLIQENSSLLQTHFGVSLDQEQLTAITDSIIQIIEEADLNSMLQESINDMVASKEPVFAGMSTAELLNALQVVSSDTLFYGALVAIAVLLALLCLLNFYNLPNALTWAAIPSILAGLLLCLPVWSVDTLLLLIPKEQAALASILQTYMGMIAQVHYTLLGIGVGLLVVSIGWRIIRSAMEKKKAQPAVQAEPIVQPEPAAQEEVPAGPEIQ